MIYSSTIKIKDFEGRINGENLDNLSVKTLIIKIKSTDLSKQGTWTGMENANTKLSKY